MRSEAELDKDVDGQTLRAHLRAIFERTGVMPKRLAEAAQCPEPCAIAWQAFVDLRSSAGSAGFGPATISYPHIDAYQRVTGPLAAWEIAAVLRADAVWLEEKAKARER